MIEKDRSTKDIQKECYLFLDMYENYSMIRNIQLLYKSIKANIK